MTVLSKPLEHECTHPVAEHYISARDDHWHCHVDGCTCSRSRLLIDVNASDVGRVVEMRFFGVGAELTRDGIVVDGRVSD
jgi:hypothetical protein